MTTGENTVERDRRDSLLKAATDAVRRQSWFESGGWTLSGMDGEGWAGLQLSKSHWFNETGDGIHFETWLAEDTVTRGLLLFQAHVMHGGMTFPGTDKKAGALSRPVIARHRELIKSWGYYIPAAPGMTLLSTRIPYEESRFVDDVVREFSRFAVLGDTIDEVLACILAGKRPPAIPRSKKPVPAPPAEWGPNLLPNWGAGENVRNGWTVRPATKVEMALSPEKDSSLRVEVGGKPTRNHDAVLRCSGLGFRKGARYRVCYEVRARVPRWMTGNIHQAEEPHFVVGSFKGCTMQSEWQTVSWEFEAERDEPNACLDFALGKVPNQIWLRAVRVQTEA